MNHVNCTRRKNVWASRKFLMTEVFRPQGQSIWGGSQQSRHVSWKGRQPPGCMKLLSKNKAPNMCIAVWVKKIWCQSLQSNSISLSHATYDISNKGVCIFINKCYSHFIRCTILYIYIYIYIYIYTVHLEGNSNLVKLSL